MYSYLHIGRAGDIADSKDRLRYRLYEVLPGLIAWLTLAIVVVFSFIYPVGITLFIIVFDTYWLIKTIYLTLHLRIAFHRVRKNLNINWREKLEALGVVDNLHWRDIHHLILLPAYKEDRVVIEATIDSLVNSHYPREKLIVILALEQRAGEAYVDELARYLKNKYGGQFLRFEVTVHPANLENEIPGKGSNIAYAGRWAVESIINPMKLDHHRVIVSALDIDTVIYPDYFNILTLTFLNTPDRWRASYQPVPFYVNNIWEAPAFARVVAFSATFWHTTKQERVESATTFSSHSMPLTALVDVGYWQRNMVSEDSRIFWQCFLRYDGQYRVVPLYYPVSMDANVAQSFWQTMINVYRQQRRWSWGCENIPYFLFGFHKNKNIPWRLKWFYGFMIMEGFWSWATNAFMIFLLGWLPLMVGGSAFNTTVLSFNLPRLTSQLMTIAMIGLATSAMMSILILPPRPPKFGRFKYFWMILQWLLFPITTLVFGAAPGLESQTRLMLGKYLGFWVTPKHRST